MDKCTCSCSSARFRDHDHGSIRNTSSKVYQLVAGQYYVIQTEGIHTWPRRSPNPPKLPGIKHVAIYAPFSHALFNMKLVLCCLFLLKKFFFTVLPYSLRIYIDYLSSSGVADRFSELSSILDSTQRQQ